MHSHVTEEVCVCVRLHGLPRTRKSIPDSLFSSVGAFLAMLVLMRLSLLYDYPHTYRHVGGGIGMEVRTNYGSP